jgi:hypothetical protein
VRTSDSMFSEWSEIATWTKQFIAQAHESSPASTLLLNSCSFEGYLHARSKATERNACLPVKPCTLPRQKTSRSASSRSTTYSRQRNERGDKKCVLPGGIRYIPAERSVLVIAAGSPWVWHAIPNDGETAPPVQWSPEALKEAGYDVTVVWEAKYDRYPTGWRDRKPDLKSRGGKNHMTLADDVVVPKLRELVAEGRGPGLIIAGSRGGQCTLPRLWDLGWRGGSICVNAGCTLLGKLPRCCHLCLVTGGLDFFKQSAYPECLVKSLQRSDPKCPVLLYHDPKMGHTGAPEDFERHGHHMLLCAVLEQIVELTTNATDSWQSHVQGTTVSGPWPDGAYLCVI